MLRNFRIIGNDNNEQNYTGAGKATGKTATRRRTCQAVLNQTAIVQRLLQVRRELGSYDEFGNETDLYRRHFENDRSADVHNFIKDSNPGKTEEYFDLLSMGLETSGYGKNPEVEAPGDIRMWIRPSSRMNSLHL